MASRDEYLVRAKRYRDKAEECRQLAEIAGSPEARTSYERLAEAYDVMGNECETMARSRHLLNHTKDAAG